eukprot:1441977-Pleurochrysis_carterae.AAC.1
MTSTAHNASPTSARAQCQDMKLLSKLICPAALERAINIDLTWEKIKHVEKGADAFGSPLTMKDFVRVDGSGAYMIECKRLSEQKH